MSKTTYKTIQVSYFAILRESRGLSEESIQTTARNTEDLYWELRKRHGFSLSKDVVRVSINDAFMSWSTELHSGDRVAFIPPVSGG